VSVVSGIAHALGVIRSGLALRLQHEVDDIGDPCDLGLLWVMEPLFPIAFGKIFGGHLFQAFSDSTSGPDAVL
jgi:hypothetical protein